MNNPKPPHTTARRTLLRSFVSVFALSSAALTASLTAQTATVTVDASSVIRDVPAGLMGSNTGTTKGAKFWQSLSPAYRADVMTARMGMVRITAYPEDTSNPANSITLADLDNRVAQVINAGGTPLFIQAINNIGRTYSDSRDAIVHAAYMDLTGSPYPAGSTATTATRIATNMAYLVNRYKSPPFNLTQQVWEVGNEPDLENVNYRVQDTAEYIEDFQAIHNQLTTLGLRANVTLCGPVVSWDYGFGGYRDTIMNDFLTACASQVDIVTRHTYANIYSWESTTDTAYALLNASFETAHFNSAQSGSRGEGKLLATMAAKGVPLTVGTGVTEMNLFQNPGGPNYRHTITQGLWFLLSDHYSLYNPRSRLTTGFKFDTYNDQLAYYKPDKSRSYPYWATYVHGALTGDQILARTSSDTHLVVTASKDDSFLYVQVLNRHNTNSYTTSVSVTNAPPVTAPTLYTLSASATPDTGVSTAYGTSFSHTFAPMTASVFRFPRTDAPVPPVTPAAPSAVHLDTGFDTAPAGLQIYSVGFTPVIASSRLQLTSTTPAYSQAAVILNGQPLPAAVNRAQARFGFKVMHPNAEGFVFGAYSASPGAVGNAGQALGYQGQANRLWGVKVDNNPDQIGVVAGVADDLVEGWATQPIAAYSGLDMYAVIDYEGAEGTVRARVYQGTNDTGALWADVTNRVGNPASLPAGTVFGFTGATSNYTQTTYIESLRITTASTVATPGTPFMLQTWTAAPWSAVSGTTAFSGAFSPDGIPVTIAFSAPKTGVNVTVPTAPVFTGAAASFFGIEGTGFGVGNTGLGRFDRGECFTLQATHAFALQEINWHECNGDEQVNIQWTRNGVAQQSVISIPSGGAIRNVVLSGIEVDANTPVVITNVSSTTANLTGRLRVISIKSALLN